MKMMTLKPKMKRGATVAIPAEIYSATIKQSKRILNSKLGKESSFAGKIEEPEVHAVALQDPPISKEDEDYLKKT